MGWMNHNITQTSYLIIGGGHELNGKGAIMTMCSKR